MNTTPLEDRVHDALHRRVDPLQHAPLSVTDVRRRAGRIQLRRRAVAGAVVAAALAVAVPVGLTMDGPARRGEVPPATTPPAPVVTGTVVIDPRSAEVVDTVGVPLVDVDAPSLITTDGTLALPRVYDTITPYGDGWVGVAMDEGSGTVELLSSDLEVEDGGPTGGLVRSADGRMVAWSEYTGSRWQVVVADAAAGTERVRTTFPPSAADQPVEPVGFVSGEEVVVRQGDETGVMTTYVVGVGDPVEVPGLLQAETASPASGLVGGLVRAKPDGSSCSAVVDALTRNGTPLWETCDHRLGSFSPDGRHLVGFASDMDGYGSPTLALLDATTGEPVVDFEVVGARRQVVGIWTRTVWEDDDTVVVRVMSGGDEFSIVRLGLDGSVRRVGIPSAGVSGLSPAEVR